MAYNSRGPHEGAYSVCHYAREQLRKMPRFKVKTQKENNAMAVKSEITFLRKYSHFPDFATGDHENDVAVCYLLKSVNVWLWFVKRG